MLNAASGSAGILGDAGEIEGGLFVGQEIVGGADDARPAPGPRFEPGRRSGCGERRRRKSLEPYTIEASR